MRHGKKVNHLSRKHAHRKAMLANMATSLIKHKRISTTVAKAKALQKYVEPLITRSKDDSTHSRRVVFSYLRDKYATAEIFREVAPKVAERPGGYTRIIKTGPRMGDNAEMCFIELVDFNEMYTKDGAKKKTRSRRGRRSGGAKGGNAAEATTEAVATEDVAVEEVATEEAAPETTEEASSDEAPAADDAEEKKDAE